VFVSDLAKLIGEGYNGERDYEEALERVLRRFKGESYQGKRELVPEERIQDVVNRHALKVDLNDASETLGQVEAKVTEASKAMSEVVEASAKEETHALSKVKAAQEQAKGLTSLENTEAMLEVAKAKSNQAQKLLESPSDANSEVVAARAKEAEQASENVKTLQKEVETIKTLKQAEAGHEKAKRKLDTAKNDQATWNRDVRSKMQCGYGTRKEDTAISLAEKQLGTTISDQQAGRGTTLFKETDHPLRIFGRVDGLLPDAVVEVKCRQRRFFGGHARWEKAQASAYCVLFDKPRVIMVEHLEGEGVRCTAEDFDTVYWESVVNRLEDVAFELAEKTIPAA
jgi:chemotaxis protein histidine kinase CheA